MWGSDKPKKTGELSLQTSQEFHCYAIAYKVTKDFCENNLSFSALITTSVNACNK